MSNSNDNANIIAIPSNTKEVLKQYGFTFKKSLGQNFLIDTNVLSNIVDAASIGEEDGVVEVGPGIGSLTQFLGQQARKVVALEIDQRLIPILEKTTSSEKNNIQVLHQDVLSADLQQLYHHHFEDVENVHVIANLPYYVTTPIIFKFLEDAFPFHHMVIMIQKEVAMRICSAPGSKQYGSLSIAVQYYCETDIVTDVPKTVFIPQPNVDSTVIRLQRRKRPKVEVKDEQHFFNVVKSAFASRRKTILNNLSRVYFTGDKPKLLAVLERCKIEPSRRGETLSIEEFALLSNEIQA
ncbi:16S rRNA (adenine(1518)-N(6)/adenine(1519)-N(6))-dimethyltransferase RsmA [Longirhabdus pacifica]|uniref:16S rRNA (adenine(1518)-N(6)/adenine(1519)-N(6))- dimethyltransferase RsmA n=1 Tax=Longirhabdus pacifica TaxID=2305227 RepID=UPI001008A2FD|nr:16S rRNA (adenine(1518)-N(6)/adenine(1519)-N(6))-dimethyltransferase RsmA [Longirhabdus pacifica]